MNRTTLDPDVLASWRLFLTAYARLIDVLGEEMQHEVDLPLDWYDVLLNLAESDGGQLRMHELAESRLLSRSATTRLVDRIEAAGYVSRTTCKQDRRGTWVVLTDAGRAKFAEAGRLHLAGIAHHFARHVTQEEASVMNAVFRRLLAALEA